MSTKKLLILALCLSGNNLFAQFSAEEYKNKSNTEIVEELKVAVEQIKSIERFSDIFTDNEEKFYDKDEVEPTFKLDTTNALTVFTDFKNTKFSLAQQFTEKGSKVQLDDGDFHGNLSDKTYTITLVPRKIFFYDGTTTDSIADLDLTSSFPEEISLKKRIDSITCDLSLSYVTAFDNVEINASKPSAVYKGHFVKLTKANKNDLEFIFHPDLDYNFVEGLNAAGKPLDDKSHSTSDAKNRDFKIFSSIRKPLEAIIASAEKDTTMGKEEFQQKYLARLEKEFHKIPDSDTMLRIGKYKGAVKGARLWFATNRNKRTTALTIKPGAYSDIHFGYKGEDEYQIMDNTGKVLFSTKESITDINPYFYDGEKSFMYFNKDKKQMEPLTYYSVEKLTATFVTAKEAEAGAPILLDKNNEKKGVFDDINAYENTIIAIKDKDVLIVTPNGKEVWIKDIEKVSEMYNGHTVIKKNGKCGFVNSEGKTVIPFEYEDAEPFDDMDGYAETDVLFAVKKAGKWGFVNTQNKIVIPFDYDEVLPFSFGITMAIKDGKRGLINTSNKPIVPFVNSTSYALSKNFGKRHYALSGGSFNYLGQKEKN